MIEQKTTVKYRVVRSARKTVAIEIQRAEVIVRAPKRVSASAIEAMVQQKRPWIEKHLAVQQQREAKKAAFQPVYGDRARLLGKEYPIISTEDAAPGFDGQAFYIPLGLEAPQLKNLLVQVYREIAEVWLPRRTHMYAQKTGWLPTGVRITAAKKRWGSCSSRGSICFSWRLMMAPVYAVDYVIVHELCHLAQPNHSSDFWALVEKALPDYKKRQAALRTLERTLAEESW